jgi:hypothetical protein
VSRFWGIRAGQGPAFSTRRWPTIILSVNVGEDRVAEIEQLFEAKGWRLRVDETDDGYEAWFYLVGVEGSAALGESP